MVSLRKLDFWFFVGFHSFILSVWLHRDIGFGIAHQSNLTIQTYNSQLLNARAETRYFLVDDFTVGIVDLRYGAATDDPN
jgi:hypothetical protein